MAERGDFFISFTAADSGWASWIAWELEAAGAKVIYQNWDFRPGSDFVREMQTATERAERTIAVLSPAFLSAEFTQSEWGAAFRKDPTGENRKLIFVRVAECVLPGVVGSRIWIDLVGRPEQDARRELLGGVFKERGKPDVAPTFPGKPANAESKPRFPGNDLANEQPARLAPSRSDRSGAQVSTPAHNVPSIAKPEFVPLLKAEAANSEDEIERRAEARDHTEMPIPRPTRAAPPFGKRMLFVAVFLLALATVTHLATHHTPNSLGAPSSDSARAPFPSRWVPIGAGSFTMGSEIGDIDEAPVHEVGVAAFEIWSTEVTVAEYEACIAANRCTPPRAAPGCTSGSDPDLPITCVDLRQAKAFAKFVGGRLPSEAEWEFAARSRGRNVVYPWGEPGTPSCALATFTRVPESPCHDGPRPVHACAAGDTREGLADMAGNVWEWVADPYHADYAGAPQDGLAWSAGPDERFVARGGAWDSDAHTIRTTNRGAFFPDQVYAFVGFRVAR